MSELVCWDYQASVKKMRPLVIRFKTMTDEMLDELHRARDELSKPGARTDLRSNERTFQGYLNDIGLAPPTVRRWLTFWNPIEKKRIEPPPRQKSEPIEQKKPIIKDDEYERRKEEALKEEPKSRPLNEIFDDVEKVIKRQENEEVFREFDLDALIEELRRRIVSIVDPGRRHHAINQIIKAMRELAIECDRASMGRN